MLKAINDQFLLYWLTFRLQVTTPIHLFTAAFHFLICRIIELKEELWSILCLVIGKHRSNSKGGHFQDIAGEMRYDWGKSRHWKLKSDQLICDFGGIWRASSKSFFILNFPCIIIRRFINIHTHTVRLTRIFFQGMEN